MSKSNYKAIADDHPGSAGAILHNLLSKIEEDMSEGAISSFGDEMDAETVNNEVQAEHAMAAVRDIVKMHINKQKDNQTTRFCLAASRNDITTIEAMCSQGFDPDSSDCECLASF